MEVDEMETRLPELQESKKRVGKKTQYDKQSDVDDSLCPTVPSTNESPSKETQLEGVRKAVVVLTRLPEYKISALRPPTPQQFYSEDDSLSSSDSDMQWEPEDDSSGSEFSLSNNKKKAGKHSTRNNNLVSDPAPVIISSAFGHCSSETTKVRPNLPEEEIRMDMVVLARKRSMKWQLGKIVEFVTKEDGRLKYKVCFEERGKSLVSGHHIAFNTTPKLEQLYVGARVVVKCQVNTLWYQPGILAELPSRKNRLRFLVFLDDHVPIYVGLPLFHLVCRPLEDVVDDIPDPEHRSFMKQYLKDWPCPHLTQYRPGQSLNVEFDGALQRCVVQLLDSSLIQVVFQDDQHKEWIHRGSMRLEHMARFLEMKGAEEDDNDDN